MTVDVRLTDCRRNLTQFEADNNTERKQKFTLSYVYLLAVGEAF
jgi:hypothetical protein